MEGTRGSDLQVFCADIGSIARGSFAWARRIPAANQEEVHHPESIEALAIAVVEALRNGEPVALGLRGRPRRGADGLITRSGSADGGGGSSEGRPSRL